MTALQIMERDIIIDTLLESTDVTDLVGDRVLWEFIARKGKIQYPYIIISLNYGGYTNVARRQETNSIWQVGGVIQDDLEIAESLINAIHDALHLCSPVIPSQYSDSVLSSYYILEKFSKFVSFKYHNQPLFLVGGLYCLQLTIAGG